MNVLGISAFYHDSAACLVRDGRVVAAAQEERFSRVKGDASFPGRAVAACLTLGGISMGDVDVVVFYDKPLLKLERILETYLALAPRGLTSFLRAAPLWLHERLHARRLIRDGLGGWDGPLRWAQHHESHAASAFFPSPFSRAAILTVDGVGEWATATIGRGAGRDLTLLEELRWPDSLGLLYSAFTYFTGFEVNEGEYKVMGLAPFGEPRYVPAILDELIDLRDDGSFTMNRSFFGYLTGLRMTSSRFDRLFGGPPRDPSTPVTPREMDLARSIQEVCQEIILRMARHARAVTGESELCMAGGVALNAVANGVLAREGVFDRVWIQPAAGDAGGALGAALLGWHRAVEAPRVPDPRDGMQGALLGPDVEAADAARVLTSMGAVFEAVDEGDLPGRVAALLDGGAVVGCARGRMEFGPRALGSRSILADPRNPAMQGILNRKIKFREGFRPFAPAVLAEHAADHFDLEGETPYMLVVSPVRRDRRIDPPRQDEPEGLARIGVPRSHLPAVTHVDGSARVQTLTADRHPELRRIVEAFHERTGCPVLVNTSFNVRGEPIVASTEDAYRCFMRTDMDAVVIGPHLLLKRDQPPLPSTPPPPPPPPTFTAGEGRRFGLTVGAAFVVLAGVLAVGGRAGVAVAAGAGGAALVGGGLLVPTRLGPWSRAWMALGRALSRVTTPVVLTLAWLAVFTPLGALLRLAGRRPLDHGRNGSSAWIARSTAVDGDSDLDRPF